MMKNISMKMLRIAATLGAAFMLASCAGEDFTPVYFPPPSGDEGGGAQPSENVGARQCTLTFTSQLCVSIKGKKIDVGTEAGDELCAEVGPFPLHVAGSQVTIEGSEFPDIKAEGHGLPAPITINARGNTDGKSNIGEGTIDAAGNMTIENFSLFIVVLGIVGEVPNLTLTTGTTDELPDLPEISGSPPDASGAMALATATVLGHTIDAADEYLMGASLTASFMGAITPPLSECGGEAERSFEVKKLVIAKDGSQSESPIPDGGTIEVSSGTYIAEGPSDVGGNFEAGAKFRIRNIGTKPQEIQIPPRKGAFVMRSIESLTKSLSPQQSFVLDVTFKPTIADTKPGPISEPLAIGTDSFMLSAVALSKGGNATVSVVNDDGSVTAPDVGSVEVGSAAVSAAASREFFSCTPVTCDKAKLMSGCTPCANPETTPCELLPVSTEGKPLGEVDAQCKQINPDAAPLLTIDLKGSGGSAIAGRKQVLAIRNKGVTDMRVTALAIEDAADSRSKGQFSIPDGAIFVAKSFASIQDKVVKALAGKKAQGTNLPVTLPPYQPGYDETTLYVVVTYEPSDLVGADGTQAGVGSKATDRATVRITTDGGDLTSIVTGTTTILEAPALEMYFKTSTGTKQVADRGSFPFRGVTPDTIDLAVPLFLRVSDTAGANLRITSITIEGPDAANFRFLDTPEKIAAVQPPSGKGMRCSIPIVDEATGQMTGEKFDLKPVPLEPPGFDLAAGAYSTNTMPLFGCVDFHRDEGAKPQRLYEGRAVVTAQEIDATGNPARNPDGSYAETKLAARLLAAINPRSGKMVMRITQTMAAILNPQFPGLSSISSRADKIAVTGGKPNEADFQLFTGALVLDPFDEMSITTSDGKEVVSKPNDGVTAVFRTLDTHPVAKDYDDPLLFDHASLLYDALAPAGSRGIYEDYPNVPSNAHANGWRIFTTSLSYPGPLAPPDKVPKEPSLCQVINPCDPEGLKLFTDAGVAGGKKGACAFFYATGGRVDSPAFHTKEEMEGGEYTKMCNLVDKSQRLYDVNTGTYTVDGNITFEEMILRISGPTYFHNPGGPLGPKPPLDELFLTGFTTGLIKPPSGPDDLNVLPDPKIDLAKGEYKISLTDKTAKNPPICENNTKNRLVGGKRYSTWRYLDWMLFKDEEGKTAAGCPEEGNKFTGGQAYLSGRKLDQETGVVTLVSAVKFGSSDDLSFAFKDVMMFLVLNGWLCDPMGREEDFEGKYCFDPKFNDHDAMGQISIIK